MEYQKTSGYLIHYASPYYDPVKAHEYYEEHKKLKGRTSTAGLNEEGRIAAQYVKSKITSEKNQRLENNKSTSEQRKVFTKSQRDSQMKQHSDLMSSRIDSLKRSLSNMSKEDKARNRERIQSEINKLREENKAKRYEISNWYKLASEQIRTDHSAKAEQIRKDASTKYEDELAKIKSEEQYQSTKGGTASQEAMDAFIAKNKAARKK